MKRYSNETMIVRQVMDDLQNGVIVDYPKQRDFVWTKEYQLALVRSILSEYIPIAPIRLRRVYTVDGSPVYQRIDGKQRTETLRRLINDRLIIPEDDNRFDAEIRGRTFSKWPEVWRNKLLNSELSAQVMHDYTDQQALEAFIEIQRAKMLTTETMLRASDSSIVDYVINKVESHPFVRKVFTKRDKTFDDMFNTKLAFSFSIRALMLAMEGFKEIDLTQPNVDRIVKLDHYTISHADPRLFAATDGLNSLFDLLSNAYNIVNNDASSYTAKIFNKGNLLALLIALKDFDRVNPRQLARALKEFWRIVYGSVKYLRSGEESMRDKYRAAQSTAQDQLINIKIRAAILRKIIQHEI